MKFANTRDTVLVNYFTGEKDFLDQQVNLYMLALILGTTKTRGECGLEGILGLCHVIVETLFGKQHG